MIVYKVLDTHGGRLTSVGTIYPHELVYHPGELLRHPNIFVFESEEAARKWVTTPEKSALWECETSSTRPAPMLILKAHYVNQEFEGYWEAVSEGAFPGWMAISMLKETPEGTVLVDDLKLIREIKL